MQEEAQALFPARNALVPLTALWLLALVGIFALGGITLRSLCGVIFAAVLLWLSFLDLRDGMLYDVITLPFGASYFIACILPRTAVLAAAM